MSTVWAYSTAAPGKTCADASLLGGGTKLEYPNGNDNGQAGWDVGLQFVTFEDLAEKLKSQKGLPITRLAINLHGSPGKIDATSGGTEAAMMDFKKLSDKFSLQLKTINGLLAPGAVVLIMGCNVAKGDDGAEFLKQLSKNAFPGHKVVGFTTIGSTMQQYRSGGFCSEAGMRDTPYDNPSAGSPKIQEQREKDNLKLPWASETSPHAKTALNGQITAGAEAPVPTTDYSPKGYLPGTWSVTIGDWSGYFLFRLDGTAYWMNNDQKQRHQGSWSAAGDGATWSFSDDAPGWTRLFAVSSPWKTQMNGNVTIKAVPHGAFTMYKQ